jgi:hypothetical protein
MSRTAIPATTQMMSMDIDVSRRKMKGLDEIAQLELPNGGVCRTFAIVDLMAAHWFQRYRKGKDSEKTFREHIGAMIQGAKRDRNGK